MFVCRLRVSATIGEGPHELRPALKNPLEDGLWAIAPYRIVIDRAVAESFGLPADIVGTTDSEGRTLTVRSKELIPASAVSARPVIGGDKPYKFHMGIVDPSGTPAKGMVYLVQFSNGEIFFGVVGKYGDTAELRATDKWGSTVTLLGSKLLTPTRVGAVRAINALYGVPVEERLGGMKKLLDEGADGGLMDDDRIRHDLLDAYLLTALNIGVDATDQARQYWLAQRLKALEQEALEHEKDAEATTGDVSKTVSDRVLSLQLRAKVEWISRVIDFKLTDATWSMALPVIAQETWDVKRLAEKSGSMEERTADDFDRTAARLSERNNHDLALVFYDLWAQYEYGSGRGGVHSSRLDEWRGYAETLEKMGRLQDAKAILRDVELLAKYEERKDRNGQAIKTKPASVEFTEIVLANLRKASVRKLAGGVMMVAPPEEMFADNEPELMRFLEGLDAMVGNAQIKPGKYTVLVQPDPSNADLPDADLKEQEIEIVEMSLRQLRSARWAGFCLAPPGIESSLASRSEVSQKQSQLQLLLLALLQHGTLSPGTYKAYGISSSMADCDFRLF